ncbi:hypothetical protein CONCODRAFT_14281 [Conidiobolus coronatus NRRL 28638]|uniref:Transmembrane protein 198 n=1 Tax=Conidiobolus coronatus (strain ATCC 28846 / CBS 209.66 / NRRL 28638) TaxID=796925 RepID=A0A137NP97_CONC2|nr:hypothetical protein CONCODRAFT_14281 [Conidiobolus coronatus NRRL 28638]|eukprot:KXN64570.1 hypothetical protein CONCODRAFT_14281 [Conidiobolus coronatus NRRL 28638]
MKKSLNQLYIFSLWFILLCLGFVSAQDASQSNPGGQSNPQSTDTILYKVNPIGTPNKSAAAIVSGVLFMVIGLLFVFVGKRLIRFLLAIAGAFTFFSLVIVISAFIVDFNNISNTQTIIILVAGGVFAVAGGILAACLWKVGMVILGFLNGATLGQIICSFFVAKPWVQLVIMGSVGLAFSIFTCFAMRFVTIAYTSFLGAHLFITGVDFIANTGYNQFSAASISKDQIRSLSGSAWAMLASVFVITIIGILFQWKTVKSKSEAYEPVAVREIPEK